jgi:hypothetical protein
MKPIPRVINVHLSNMTHFVHIFFFAACLAFLLIHLGMVAGGLVKGKMYYAAGSPPIVFREHPLKFVVLTTCLIVMSACFGAGAVFFAKIILE